MTSCMHHNPAPCASHHDGLASAHAGKVLRPVLLDVPDDCLLLILQALPAAYKAATACKRFCRLLRSTVLKCDLLCAWPRGHNAGLLDMLTSMPQLSRLRLNDVPAWITHDAAALDDLACARQDAKDTSKPPLWLAFCERTFRRRPELLEGVCNLPLVRDVAAQALAEWSRAQFVQGLEHELSCARHLRSLLGPAWQCLGARELHALASMTALQELDLADNVLDDTAAQALAGLTQLRSLRMAYHACPAWEHALAELTALRILNLTFPGTSMRQYTALFDALSQLQHLSLVNARMMRQDVHAFLALTALRTLHLPHTTFQGPSWALLSSIGCLSLLHDLNLTCTGVDSSGPEGIQLSGLAVVGTLQSLRRLNLTGNTCGPDSHWCYILQSPNLANLEALDIAGSACSAADVRKVAQLTALTHLNISAALADSSSVAAVTALRTLTRLQTLGLGNNCLRYGHAAGLLCRLTTLRSLSLEGTDVGYETLIQLRFLSQLEDLDLAGCILTAACAGELEHLPALRHLCVGLEQLTPEVVVILSALYLQRLDVRYRVPQLLCMQLPDYVGVARCAGDQAFVLDLGGDADLEAVLARAVSAAPVAVQAAHAAVVQAAREQAALHVEQQDSWVNLGWCVIGLIATAFSPLILLCYAVLLLFRCVPGVTGMLMMSKRAFNA